MKATEDFFKGLRKEIEKEFQYMPTGVNADACSSAWMNDSDEKKQMLDMEMKYNAMKAKYDFMKKDYDFMKNDYNFMKSDYDVMRKDYKFMKDDYDVMRKDYKFMKDDYDVMRKDYKFMKDDYDVMRKERDTMKAENERLQKEPSELQAKIEELQKKHLPITTFLTYVEDNFPAEQNDRAKVVKEVLGDLFTNPSKEERKRLRVLGTKEKALVIEKVNDIHHNQNVTAGI